MPIQIEGHLDGDKIFCESSSSRSGRMAKERILPSMFFRGLKEPHQAEWCEDTFFPSIAFFTSDFCLCVLLSAL
jgi:hypothetical protein